MNDKSNSYQITLANLSVAAHALREEPYKRLPYLAGMISVAGSQLDSLRHEHTALFEAAKAVCNSLDEPLVCSGNPGVSNPWTWRGPTREQVVALRKAMGDEG